MKKCPPGVICLENITILIIICVLIFIYFLNSFKQNIILNNRTEPNQNSWFTGFPSLPSFPYTNMYNDVLLNPYVPPLSDERYFVGTGRIPINIQTNVGAVDTNYRQMGILTGLNTKNDILSLMGRPVFTNRDKWQYYTISNQHNNVKLPISRNGKSCTNEYGCDRLFNGDSVYVEGINEPYRITIYDNDTIRYLPFL